MTDEQKQKSLTMEVAQAMFQKFKTDFLDAGLSGKVSTSTYNQAVQRINDIEAVIGSARGDDDSVINKVREMIDFFANIPETDTLASTLAALNTAIGGKADSADLAAVATSGDYDDLSNKPSIPTVPTNVSAFNNDAGYLTEHQDISGKVDKVTGKGLSTNDYDNAAKTKVDAIPANPKYTDTTYESKPAASGGTDVSLVTTGEKYEWNQKEDKKISMWEYLADKTVTSNGYPSSVVNWSAIEGQVKLDYTPVPFDDHRVKKLAVDAFGGLNGGTSGVFVKNVPGIENEITVSQAAVALLSLLNAGLTDVRRMPYGYFFIIDSQWPSYSGNGAEVWVVERRQGDNYLRMPFLGSESPNLRLAVIESTAVEFWYNHLFHDAPELTTVSVEEVEVVGNTWGYALLGQNLPKLQKISLPACTDLYFLVRSTDGLKVVDVGDGCVRVLAGFISFYKNDAPTFVLESIIMRATTPPAVVDRNLNVLTGVNPFYISGYSSMPSSLTLYVPDDSVAAYKADSCWGLFETGGMGVIKGLSEYSE